MKKIVLFFLVISIFAFSVNISAFGAWWDDLWGGTTTYTSNGEQASDATKIIGSAAVFMSNCDYCYYSKAKKTYAELGVPAAYEDKNGVIMVPIELLNNSLNVAITHSNGTITASGKTVTVGTAGELDAAPVEKDGTIFVPAASFTTKILGKYAYYDGRPFVVVSNSSINLSNSDAVTENRENSDILYRYMQFQRPEGDVIYNAVVQNSYQSHPRLLMTKDEIPSFRQKIQNTPELQDTLSVLLLDCANILSSEPTKYQLQADGLRLFEACYAVRTNILKLSIAYYATGESKYLDRMWAEAQSALGWKDWNTSKHYLDSGEIGAAMAIAYDTLYDYLTDEQKSYFREKITALYIDDAVDRYCDTDILTDSNLTISNWGAVCFNSILMNALTFIDEESSDSELTQKCKFLAAETIKGLEFPLGNLMPDGSICDGVGYLSYYSENLSWSFCSLLNVCGTDYGLIDAPCYKEMADFAMYIQSPIGCLNFSDTPEGEHHTLAITLMAIAKLSNDPGKMKLLSNLVNLYGSSLKESEQALLWYEPTEYDIDYGDYPLDKLISGQQIVTMRSSWGGLNFSYLAAMGGENMELQSHFDKGSFNLDLGGVRWFEDLGADNYNVAGGYWGEDGFTLYRTKTEGHNCLVINPDKTTPGQTFGGYAPVSYMESKEKGAIAVYDLKDVYQGQVNYYNRGFCFAEDRNTLVVRDELELKNSSNDIYWFLHTANGKINISADGKSATVEKNGKKLKVEVLCDATEWKLEVRDADYLFPEMDRGDEFSRAAYKKIALVGKAAGKLNISAKFSVIDDGNTYAPLTDTPISEWSIPDGEIVRKPQAELLTSPVNGDYIYNENGITVKGSIVEGFEAGSAKIYIDGVLKRTLDNNTIGIDEVISPDEIAELDYGKHELTIEVIYDGQKLSSTKEFILTDVYNHPISDPMAGKGRESSFTSGMVYSFTHNSDYAFSNDNGSVSFTRSSGSNGTDAKAYFAFADYKLNSGKFILKTKLTVSDPSKDIFIDADNKNGQLIEWDYILKDGKFFTTGKSCEANTTYDIEIIYDLTDNTKTYKVDGEIIKNKAACYDKNIIGQMRSYDIVWYGSGAAKGAKVTFDDFRLYHTMKLPLISHLEYIVDNESVSQDKWENGFLSCDAQSVVVVMENKIDKVPDVIVKKSGSPIPIRCSLTADKTMIIITPDGGFEPNTPYDIALSDVVCDGTAYAKKLSASFYTQQQANVPEFYNKPISDPMTGKGRESSFTSGILYSFTSNSDYTYSNDNGSVSFTRTAGSNGTDAKAYLAFGDYKLDNGKFILKTKLTVSDPSKNIVIDADNKSGQLIEYDYILKDGKFFSSDMVCEANAAYNIEIIYDLSDNTKTYKVNGDILQNKVPCYGGNRIKQFRSYDIVWEGSSASKGSKVTFDDFQLFHAIKVPPLEILSPADGAIIDNTDGILLSASAPNGYTDVQFLLDGQKIIPEAVNGVYSANIADYNISHGAHKFTCVAVFGSYTVTKEVSFETVVSEEEENLQFEILTPSNNEVIENQRSILLSVSVPKDHTDVQFFLDGQNIMPEVVKGIYSANVAWDNIPLGVHKFICKAVQNNQTQIKEIYFETTGSAKTVWLNKSDIVSTSSASMNNPLNASDSDISKFTQSINHLGNQNSALKMPGDTRLNVSYQSQFKNNTICFDGWVKREEGTAIYFPLEGMCKNGWNIEINLSRAQDAAAQYFIDENGNFLDIYSFNTKYTDITTVMPANEWHHIRWTLDTNTYLCNIYYDGTLIQSTIHDSMKTWNFKPVQVGIRAVNSNTGNGMYLDEAKVFMIEPKVNDVSYIVGADTITGNGYTVPLYTKSIILDMSNSVMNNAETSKVWTISNVKINGEAVANVTQIGNKITIVPSKALSPNQPVLIELGVPDGYSNNPDAFKAITVYLTPSEENIGTVSITSFGTGITATVKVRKIDNNSVLPNKCVMIVASYDENDMVAFKVEEKTLSVGENSLNVTLNDINGGTNHKVFLWDTLTTLKPLK